MNRTVTFVCLKEVNAPFNELRNTEVKTFGRHYISAPQMHQYIYIYQELALKYSTVKFLLCSYIKYLYTVIMCAYR